MYFRLRCSPLCTVRVYIYFCAGYPSHPSFQHLEEWPLARGSRPSSSSNVQRAFWKEAQRRLNPNCFEQIRGGKVVGKVVGNIQHLHPLKLAANAPENRPKRPKRKRSYSKHPFSGANLLLVSGVYNFSRYIPSTVLYSVLTWFLTPLSLTLRSTLGLDHLCYRLITSYFLWRKRVLSSSKPLPFFRVDWVDIWYTIWTYSFTTKWISCNHIVVAVGSWIYFAVMVFSTNNAGVKTWKLKISNFKNHHRMLVVFHQPIWKICASQIGNLP